MKKFTITKLMTAMSFLALGMFMSCGKDEKVPVAKPVAAFTVEASGKTITITNTSTDAVSYAWEFGDTESSTEEAPTHTYLANGSYVVKLTVTNESGTDDAQAVSEIINITIDGNFDDWDDVAIVGTPAPDTVTNPKGKAIREVKIENLGNNKLYVYVRATSVSELLYSFFFNFDYGKLSAGDTTGYVSYAYGKSNLGWETLLQGVFGDPAAVPGTHSLWLNDDDDLFTNNLDWGTGVDTHTDVRLVVSESKSVGSDGDIAFEFVIDLTAFPTGIRPEEGAEIQFFMQDLYAWSPLGHYPLLGDVADNTETTEDERLEAATYKLK